MHEPITLKPDRPAEALVVSICNQKGGIGKTTSTCHLARAASSAGLDVLVVDLDPQGNTTATLAAEQLPMETVGVADAITPHATVGMDEVLAEAIWPRVTLAPTPGTDALSEAESRIESIQFGRESALAEALAPVLSKYDVVLVDNSPALGRLLINALTASGLALVVTEPEQWSADGLAKLHRTVDLVQRHHNPRLRWSGPLVNQKRQSAQHDRIVAEIRDYYGDSAWTDAAALVPQWAGIADHLLAGIGLDESRETRLRVLADAYGQVVRRLLADGGRI